MSNFALTNYTTMPFTHELRAVIPADPNTVIWKYFKRQYFESLINDNALYFGRVIDFANADPLEGTIPRRDRERDRFDALLKAKDFNDLSHRVQMADSIDPFGMRHGAIINCWKMADYEMAHMWKQYAKIDDGNIGVAVRSTVGSLQRSFQVTPHEVYGSKVRYIDYEYDTFFKKGEFEESTWNVGIPIIHKSIHGYPDENEYRLVHQWTGGGVPEEWWDDHGDYRGLKIRVDLDELISQVVVSPNADEKILEEIRNLCRSKLVSRPVTLSRMRPSVQS